MRRLLFTALVTSLLLSACNEKEVKTEQLSRVVWSDDNTEQALVMLRHSEQNTMNPAAVGALPSSFTHQIYIQNSDGSNRRPVGIEFQGQSGHDLYYMKAAGYLIATLMQASANGTPEAHYFQVKLDGRVNRLTEHPFSKVIPSPDGQYLARVREFPATCSNPAETCPVHVDILSAETLQKVGSAYQFSFSSGQPETTWTPDGRFVVTNGSEAEALTPGSASVESTSTPACTYPPTSSNPISFDGSYVFAQAGQIQIRPAAHNEKAFGCQNS